LQHFEKPNTGNDIENNNIDDEVTSQYDDTNEPEAEIEPDVSVDVWVVL